jgi:hypothetical protein
MSASEDDEGSVMGVVIDRDGKWFVVEHTPDTGHSRAVAGPYQTEAAALRWTADHPPRDDAIAITVQCRGSWQDAIRHAEAAWAEWKKALAEKRVTVIGHDDPAEDDDDDDDE